MKRARTALVIDEIGERAKSERNLSGRWNEVKETKKG